MSNEKEAASFEFQRVATLDRRALEVLMVQGERPELDALPGWEYRGMNIGIPARLLRIQKFIKGFLRLPSGEVCGYNVRVRQNGPTAPWVTIPIDEAPRRFGFYRVTPVTPAERDNAYLHALLLDYGQGGNGRLNPLSTLRDYLVRVAPGSDDLLLGKAFMAVWQLRVPVGYFLLERYRSSDYRG
ncbi:MAG: hypothetical protein M3220_18115 [Chloroflexota bacterium]|nr:hypothetical protein [Chloroflexota bacterium]